MVLAGETFSVGTYNLENYLDVAVGTRPAKSAESRAKVRETLRLMRADVLALQEIGRPEALLELRSSLKAEGLDYPHWEHVRGFDTNIFVAVLSRFPIVARRPHTNESYLLEGRRLQVSRGFAEVDIRVNQRYAFTLMAAHLKSRRTSAVADESGMREQEALRLREFIDARLRANPRVNLVVLGDFNDTKDTRPIRLLVGTGRSALVDTRPAEANGDRAEKPEGRSDPRQITWTHYYAREDAYDRVDYLLLSPGMAREWEREQTRVVTIPDWGLASDHRPIVAAFAAEDR